MRIGNISASGIWQLMVEPRKKSDEWSQTALSYMKSKAVERLTGIETQISASSLEWGNEHEPEAISLYCSLLNKHPLPIKRQMKDYISGECDLLLDDRLAEIKSPFNSINHLDNLLIRTEEFKKERREYFYQCQTYMHLYDRDTLDFVSYDPRFKGANRLSIIRLKKDQEVIDQLIEKAHKAEEFIKEIIRSIQIN